MSAPATPLSCLHPGRWLARFAALVRRWSWDALPRPALDRRRRKGAGGAAAAPRRRFHPVLDTLEERYYPNDLFGLLYSAPLGVTAAMLAQDAFGSGVEDTSPTATPSPSPAYLPVSLVDPGVAGPSAVNQARDLGGAPDAGPVTPDTAAAAAASSAAPSPAADSGPLADPWLDAWDPALSAPPPASNGPPPGGTTAPPALSGNGMAGATASPLTSAAPAPAPAPAPSSSAPAPDNASPSVLAQGPTAQQTGPAGPPAAAAALAPSPAASSTSPAATADASGTGSGATTAQQPPGFAALAQNYAKLPLAFEENVGQTDPSVRFLSHGPGFSLFLTDSGPVMALTRPNQPRGASRVLQDVVRLDFQGASASRPVAAQELPARSNYYLGSGPSSWYEDVPEYARVTYHDLYPGIDAVYYGTSQRQLEFDLVVQPGADPSAIRFTYQGAQGFRVDGQGNLLVQTAGGTLVQQAPFLYQRAADGTRQAVPGSYTLGPGGAVGFQPGRYDGSRALYIDPILNYSSYLGGSGDDFAYGVAVDPAGNAYLTGSTASSNFPNTTGSSFGGATDVFVSKISPQTGLVYSAYLPGSFPDQGNAIAVDNAGNAYVTGYSDSSNFPVTSGAYQSGHPGQATNPAPFLTKLNITGDALLYSTYFGSTNLAANGSGTAVAVDGQGYPYLTGYTSTGTGFPTTTGAFQATAGGGYDAWVAKFNPNASGSSSLVYSTLLGGSADDKGYGIAVDGSGDAYVTGSTGAPSGTGFPTTTGAYMTSFGSGTTKAFVTKVNPTGTGLVYSTLLGGTGSDQGNAIAINLSGNAYVTGTATSTNFPTTTGAYQTTSGGGNEAFATELNTAGSGLVYSTYLGGSGNDEGNGIAVDGSGYAFVAGETASTNFPTSNAIQASSGGLNDAFLTRLNAAGTALSWSTYLGGSSDDAAQAVALDPAGNAYLAGWTKSSNFPTSSGAYQGTNAGGADAFITKIGNTPNRPILTGISPDTGSSSSDQITTSQNLTLSGTAAPGATVTVSRAGVGVLGSVTADATTGAWSYDYSGTTLPEGTYAFTATATLGGLTSLISASFLVTVDRTAPSVTVTAPSSTANRGPQVRVTASDLNGLPNGTTVSVDVDLNNNGSFTDPGETGYASGTLTDGTALITLPALAGPGTYPVRARVTDLAGNQATSATQTIVVTSQASWTMTAQALTSDPLTGDAPDQLGDVQFSHALDLDQSPGTDQSGNAALVYNSDSTSVLPVVQAVLQTPNNASVPSQLTAQLTWNGVQGGSQTFMVSGSPAPGSTLVVSVQPGSAVTATGRYPWSLTVTPQGGSPITASGVAYVVVQDGSAFGSGWTLSNVDQLVSIAADSNGPAGVLRLYGTGGARFYTAGAGGSYTSPPGDNGTLSFANNVYTYQTPDGQKWLFNSSGQETNWVSADGNQLLTFTYSGGQLTGMTAIDGAVATFSYSGSLVQTIQTGSRTVTLSYSGTNLASVTNPDGGVHTFTYDGSHHLTGDQLANVQHGWAYNHSTLATYTFGSSSSPTNTVYAPVAADGLAGGVTNFAAVGSPQATVTDPLGHKTSWQLDGQGRPLQEIQPDGGTWAWARDANGNVTVQTDPLNRVTSYQYDASNYVTQVTQPDGSTLGYQYQTAFHALTRATDELGHITTYTYDSGGHEVTLTNPLNQTTTYGYTANGLLQTVTDPLNHTTTYQHDSSRRLTQVTDALGNTTQYTYDGNGNPLTTTDALSRVTTTSYDVMGRLTQITDPLGNTESATYNAAGLELTSTDPLGRVTSLTYDSYNRGLVSRDTNASNTPAMSGTLSSYNAAGLLSAPRDADGFWTTYTYDPLERVTQVTDALGGVSRQVYDLAGQLVASRDALGRWTFYRYNSRGKVTAVIDPLGNTTTYAYDLAGNQTTVTDPLNHTTTFQYDALNRQTVTTDPMGFSVTTTYDPAGNVSTVTDQLGTVTSYAYDADNRQVTETDAAGTAVQRTLTTAYDAVDNVTASTDGLGHTTQFGYDKDNRQTATTDPLGHTTTTSYDAAGNVTSVQDPLGRTNSYAYDALNRQVSRTDPLGHTATMAYDALGRVVASTDPLGDTSISGYDPLGRPITSLDPRGYLTVSQYDAVGNLLAVTDADGNQTVFVYDGLDRKVKMTDPLGRSSTVAYDAAGRETSATDRLGRVQNFTYDADDRQTGGAWVAGGTTVNTQTYTYDHAGNPLTAADATGTYTFTYDALSREQSLTNPFGLTLTYGYDAADNSTLVQDSLGGVLTSVYDAADRLTSRRFGGTGQTPLRIDLGYNNRDELTGLTRYSDLAGTQLVGTTSYSYDASGNVTSIVHKNASAATLSYYNYGYDAANRVTSQTWQSGSTPGSQTYAYDAASELTGDGTHTYSYDPTGNRTIAGYQTGAGNQLTTDGVWTYTYDAEGNQTQKSKGAGLETWYYGYDTQNRLTSVRQTSDGSTNLLLVTYTYDVLGNRIEQDEWTPSTGVVTTRFAYDGRDVWADLSGSNALLARYLRGDQTDQVFARIVSSGQPNAGVAWYLTDAQGSVRDLMDSTQTLRDHLDYDGYGNATETNAGFGDRYKYTGREFDPLTGLQYNRARSYDPKTGRWLSQDPMGFAAGDANLYRYTANDPTNATDPSGLWTWNDPFGIQRGLDSAAEEVARGLGLAPPPPSPPARPNPGHWYTGPSGMRHFVYDTPGSPMPPTTPPPNPPPVSSQPPPWYSRSAPTRWDEWVARYSGWDWYFDWMGRQCIGPNNEYQGIPPPNAIEQQIPIYRHWRQGLSDWDHGAYVSAIWDCVEAGLDVESLTRPRENPAPVRVNCFPSDTLVGSETGLRPIGQIEAGERVWAYDFQGGTWRLCRVECRHDANYDGPLVSLYADVGQVTATAFHPFWVIQGDDLANRPTPRHLGEDEDQGGSLPGRWVNSHDLREGDVIFLKGRGPVTLRRVVQRLEQTPVCNLTVEGLHTFAVGEMQVLVHNTSGTGGPVWNAGARRWIDPATGRFVSGPRPPSLPATAAESPGPGWEWRGAPGEPVGGSRGAWFRPGTGETLHPDLAHPAPVGPHWDWRAPDGTFWRMFPDGTIVPRP